MLDEEFLSSLPEDTRLLYEVEMGVKTVSQALLEAHAGLKPQTSPVTPVRVDCRPVNVAKAPEKQPAIVHKGTPSQILNGMMRRRDPNWPKEKF